jgi:hypothetical protein
MVCDGLSRCSISAAAFAPLMVRLNADSRQRVQGAGCASGAAVRFQVKHLNLIGVYLRNVRAECEVVGAARKSNRGLPKLFLNGRARGIFDCEYSSRARCSGSILMAISQGEEFSFSRRIKKRLD